MPAMVCVVLGTVHSALLSLSEKLLDSWQIASSCVQHDSNPKQCACFPEDGKKLNMIAIGESLLALILLIVFLVCVTACTGGPLEAYFWGGGGRGGGGACMIL